MKMEVMIPLAAVEFNFDVVGNSPYVTAPSTPRGFGNFFFSAPSSPTRFNWEQSPLILPFTKENIDHKPDFEFDFNSQLGAAPLSVADEIFDCGKIKPIKLNRESKIQDSPESPQSLKKNRFSGAIRRTPGGLSVLRISDVLLEEEKDAESSKEASSSSSSSSSSASDSPSSWSRRWKIRDLLLFRSVSEGRAEYSKNHLLKKSEIEAVKNSIYSSTAVVNSMHITKKRKEKRVSAHELHYRVNREVSQEMRRKTFLPYRKTVIMGC